jgi:hypothetical protein
MRTPKPDPAGDDADQIRPEFERALNADAWSDAINLAVRAMYVTALNICKSAGVEPPRPPPARLLELCIAFRSQCDAHLAANEDDFRVQTARHAFDVMAEVETVLRQGTDGLGPADIVARLMLIGTRLGHADMMLTMVTSGLLADYGEALSKLHSIGDHLRDRVPDWEKGFLSRAKAYCEGRAKVTLAELRREARRWADDERLAKRNPALPATDKGIDDGIKRMEASRKLTIPGRSGGN